MKMKWKKLVIAVLMVFTMGASFSALAEEIQSRKMSILQVEGTEAYFVKPTGSKYKAAKGFSLGAGSKVSTGDKTYVYISADDDKTFKMDANSVITISKASSKLLEVELQDGQLFFNVDKPLGADEEMNFRVANTSMSIRGTSGWMKYGISDIVFFLAEGNVVWSYGDEEIEVKPGQKITLERDWGGEAPAPGRPLIYRLKSVEPYTWTDLPEDALIAFMEHRAAIDLSALGLDTPEKIAEAAAKAQAIVEARKPKPEPVREEKRAKKPAQTEAADSTESTEASTTS